MVWYSHLLRSIPQFVMIHRVKAFQSSSDTPRVQLFATPWTTGHQVSVSITNSQSLLKFTCIETAMPSNHLILCCPFSTSLQSFLASGSFPKSQFFHIRWPRYWSFSFSSSHSNKYSGVIFFRIDWFDLLTVQRTVKSLLLQHHSSKASILQCSVSL